MNRTITTLLISFLSLTYCIAQDTTVATNTPSKMKQVVALHDEVMAKMGDLVKQVGHLQNKVNSSENKTVYKNAITDLKSANTNMMTWMHNFSDHFNMKEMLNDAPLNEVKQKLLLSDEKKIKEIQKEVTTSMNKAKTLLVN